MRVFHQCNLHIHGEHSRNNRIVPMLALSEPTAIGLVIAHGNLTATNTTLVIQSKLKFLSFKATLCSFCILKTAASKLVCCFTDLESGE